MLNDKTCDMFKNMFKNIMQCRRCTAGADKTQEHLEICEYTTELRHNMDLNKEWDHMLLWWKMSKINKPTYSDQPSAATRVKATRGGISFQLKQIPERNNLESLD